jgi:sec-independent protein translocase protein TatA
MLGNLTGWHLLIILAVVVLIFGAAKLPALAKGVGQSMRILRGEMKTMKDESASPADVATDADAQPVTSAKL